MRRILTRLTLSLVFAVVFLLTLEGAASAWTAWAKSGERPEVRESTHCDYDPELGWLHRPNTTVPDQYGPGVGITTNGQRLRGTQDYALEKPEGTYRILCLGDSFTMGYGVADDATYPTLIEVQGDRIETINMGLGGYGIDQCYLWYLREGVKFEIDLLLFAFIEGDFHRMRPDGNVANRAKPLLELIEGEPVAVNLPVPNIVDPPAVGRLRDLWKGSALHMLLPRPPKAPKAKRLHPSQEAFAPVALRIFEKLRDLSAERGQRFVLANLPVQRDSKKKRSELLDDWLIPALAQREIPFVDLRAAFKRVPAAELPEYFVLGHYSRLGNTLAARELLTALRLLDPACPQ